MDASIEMGYNTIYLSEAAEKLKVDFDLATFIERLSVMFQVRCERKGLTWQVQWTSEDERGRTPRLPVNGMKANSGRA